jgi:iron(II)-dependent oxidoreductase
MKIFVSYSRSVKTDVGKVIDLLRAIGHEVWWDGDIPIMADWWATILDNIEWCEVFIFVVSEKSVQSAYCLAELAYATERNRPILPFVMDDHTKYPIPAAVTPMRAQWYVYNGDPAHMINRLKDGMAGINWDKHRDIYAKRPPEPNTNTASVIKLFQDAQKLAYAGKFDEAKTAFRNVSSNDFREWGQECQEWLERINRYAEIYELAGDRGTVNRAVKKWNDFKARYGTDFDPFDLTNNPPVLPAPTPPPMPKPVYTPPRTEPMPESIKPAPKPVTPPQEDVVQPKPIPEPIKPPQQEAVQPKPIVDVAQPPPKPIENEFVLPPSSAGGVKGRFPVFVGIGGIVGVLALVLLIASGALSGNNSGTTSRSTNTPRPSATNTEVLILPTGTARPSNAITRNADWTPQERSFNGVTMVLVPTGCFMMGRATVGIAHPAHEQCFDTPFWIDKYEVTQAQFTQFGGQINSRYAFTGDNRPVNRIDWYEARDFCVLRGGRLPTEREWEYAARGPDNLIYPWGNSFIANNVVYSANSGNQPANVGSRPNGVSWVGALDMAGNIWEWVSGLYSPYPYGQTNEDDEDVSISSNFRVFRGGSWDSEDYEVRASDRGTRGPGNRDSWLGFRCVLSYSP